jgi:hypothetical protein
MKLFPLFVLSFTLSQWSVLLELLGQIVHIMKLLHINSPSALELELVILKLVSANAIQDTQETHASEVSIIFVAHLIVN